VAEMLTRQESVRRRDYEIRELQGAGIGEGVSLALAPSAGRDRDDEDVALVGQSRLEERIAR
jgi:hypothetical protein